MLRRFVLVILITIMIFLFTSCNKTNDENAIIQIWSYDFNVHSNTGYPKTVSTLLSNAKFFCDNNGIPVEIIRYSEKDISYDDYVLKRNAAAATNGNMIIIENVRNISDLDDQQADYTKLESYNKLIDVYKDRFCIPLGVGHRTTYKYNNAINYYNIKTDNPLITYEEYLNIKQQMKEKGARFKISYLEFLEIIDYYLIKNNIKYVNGESEILKDSNRFNKILKNTVIDLCDDFKLYNDKVLYGSDLNAKRIVDYSYNKKDFIIYDENSELILSESPEAPLVVHYQNYVNDSIIDKTFVLNPYVYISPCFFMYKKITNDKIYDLANYIVSESSYFYVAGDGPYYTPVFNGDKTKKMFNLNETWQYEGEYKARAEKGNEIDKRIYALYDGTFEMLVRNKETSNLLASYFFTNIEYSDIIYNFVADMIIELSNKNYDYKNEEINIIIDNKINEFVTNFNVHYN